MKSTTLIWSAAIAVFAMAIVPHLAAQHTRYKLIDISPFGGPSSYINPSLSFGSLNPINSPGAVGAAATSIPATPTSSPFVCGGPDGAVPFVFHAFEWHDEVVIDL